MEKRRLLKIRKQQKSKKPAFRRANGQKKKKLDVNWRRPRGLQGKLRKKIAAKGAVVQIGYGSPRAVKGLHPSGFEDVLVRNLDDLQLINPEDQAARIARTVGVRKRLIIEEIAADRGIKVLNPLPVTEEPEEPEEPEPEEDVEVNE